MSKSPVIIAVTGCASSGKTTILNDLEKILSVNYNVIKIPELVRILCDSLQITLYDIENRNLMFEFEQLLLNTYIFLEKFIKKEKCDIILLDRTIWDILVYTKLFHTSNEANKIKMMIDEYKPKYDYIIYCEPLEFKEDKFRINYRKYGEIKLFEEIVKPKTDIILEPAEHYIRIQKILNDEKFKQLIK